MLKILFIFCSIISFNGFAQPKRYVSIEIGGVGGFGSINYEQTFLQKEQFTLSLRAGISFSPIDKNNGHAIIFPIIAHGVVGKGPHKLDLGLGQALTITSRGQAYLKMPASIGYRLEPIEKRYYLRFAYTPIFNYIFDFNVQHWGGITYGYKLKNKS